MLPRIRTEVILFLLGVRDTYTSFRKEVLQSLPPPQGAEQESILKPSCRKDLLCARLSSRST